MLSKRLAMYGVVCAGAGVAFGPPLATAAIKYTEVVVRNTDEEPIPIKAIGTTAVAGTVGISGTPAVSVSGTPTVKLANEEPIAVTSADAAPAGTPIQRSVEFTFSGVSMAIAEYEVPAGKRLEIQHVTFYDQSVNAGVERFSLQSLLDGVGVMHYLKSSPQPGNGETVTEPVKIFADPGSSVYFYVRLTEALGGSGNNPNMFASFTGVLTDA